MRLTSWRHDLALSTDSRMSTRRRQTQRGRRLANTRSAIERLEDRTLLAAIAAPADMIGWWPGDGHALDVVGGNHGTLQNGASFAAGRVGQAFTFDGTNDFVQVAHDPSLNPAAGLTQTRSTDRTTITRIQEEVETSGR